MEARLELITEEVTDCEERGFLRPPLTGLFKGPVNSRCSINSAGCWSVASRGAQETCVQQALQQGRAGAGSSVSSNASSNRRSCLASVTQHPWVPSGGVEWAVAWNAWS